LTDLDRGFRELGIRFGVVGALVPELLLSTRPKQMTNDADVTVVLGSLADFETLKDQLANYGFTRTKRPHRMRHATGGLVDLLPFSDSLAPQGRLELEEGFVFNTAGLRYVVPHAVQAKIEGGPLLPLAPLPLYALLKLVAYSDRREPKDLAGVFHCLRHYAEENERRYGLQHNGEDVPYEYTCAFLLGLDGRMFLDKPLADAITRVLDRFRDADADVVGLISREMGRFSIDDGERSFLFEHFRWYRFGTGL
jgi:predicted nucleotidyltransferase